MEYLIQKCKTLTNVGIHWLKYDIDGWRLDVSDEVSHQFWRHFRLAVKQRKQIVINWKNWHHANSFYVDQFDNIMNYIYQNMFGLF